MRQRSLSSLAALALLLGAGAGPAFGAGSITTVAGPGVAGTPGDGGPATQAFIGTPVGVTALPDGSYLIAHQGNAAVRRVFPDGTIATVAGNNAPGYSGDGGPATSASFSGTSAAVPTPDGGYLIADPNNNAIRRVAPDGIVSTVAGMPTNAGFSGDGGKATAALLMFPYDMSFLSDGTYLVADADNDRIRRVDSNGNIDTVAGSGASLGDNGPAAAARLDTPRGVTATPDGGYMIADTFQHRIRKVGLDGMITTVAGDGSAAESGDGNLATSASINTPIRVALEPDGGFLIADDAGARVRRVAPDGTISTVAGTTAGFGGDGGPATAAQLNRPFGVAVLPSRDILIADANNDRIRFVDVETPPPTLTGTSPASPAADNQPRVLGSSPAGTTVALFTDPSCQGDPVATGSAVDLGGDGIALPVPDNSTTTIHAVSIDAGGNSSACSTSAVTYEQKASRVPLPPPVQGRLANAVPAKGRVLVKVPGGRFVPLESLGRQLPVGTTVDTTKGTVLLTVAKNRGGATQFGRFSKGVFKFAQTRKNPLTTVSMVGAGLSSCSRLPRGGAPRVVAAKKRRRTLFSNVKGRFRSRGRNSTATVRGTSWTMTDTCKGTLTSVKTGSVTVRDFNLRKTRVVAAGHSYLARAPLRKKPRKSRG
jgi:hypothetical protein